MTYITPLHHAEYETDIALVMTKGTRKKPIGKTGYSSQKVVSVSSKAPTYYRLINKDGKTIDQFLSMKVLKEKLTLKRLSDTTTPYKPPTLSRAAAIAKAYADGFKSGVIEGGAERYQAGYDDGFDEGYAKEK